MVGAFLVKIDKDSDEAFLCEFDCVAHQILKDVGKPLLVNVEELGDFVGDIVLKLNLLLLRFELIVLQNLL